MTSDVSSHNDVTTSIDVLQLFNYLFFVTTHENRYCNMAICHRSTGIMYVLCMAILQDTCDLGYILSSIQSVHRIQSWHTGIGIGVGIGIGIGIGVCMKTQFILNNCRSPLAGSSSSKFQVVVENPTLVLRNGRVTSDQADSDEILFCQKSNAGDKIRTKPLTSNCVIRADRLFGECSSSKVSSG